MRRRKFLKYVIATVFALVFTMLASDTGHDGVSVNEVQAAGTVTKGYVIVPKANVTITKKTSYDVMTISEGYEDDKYADYIFAGWYQNQAATMVATSETNRAYARFVPADILSTKCQVTNGVITNTSVDSYKGKYVLRFVSSIDNAGYYNNVGFQISYKDGDKTITRTAKTNTVFRRIESTTGSGEELDTYKFSPKVIDTKSEYFITAKWPVEPTTEAMSNDISVRAFWTTKDGTRVYGPSRRVCVNDGLSATQTINMSFENTKDVSVNVDDELQIREDVNASARVIGVNGATIHVRISGINKNSMKSATMFTFTANGSTVGKEIYRNLYTKYAGTADETWHTTYQLADSTEKEFTIATNADLYGFATLTNSGSLPSDATIYLVSDIEIQDGDASTWVSDTPELTWTPIGTVTQNNSYKDELINPFDGTFDGQGHIIRGVYINAPNSPYQGLFGATGTSAILRDFELENSYIACSYASGAIAGAGNGTFENIYSEAIVAGTSSCTGGLIGRTYNSGLVMRNCWNAGTVSTSRTDGNTSTGGLVGLVGVASSFTDCMNTGSVMAIYSNTTDISLGGLVGYAQANVTITDSLNTGSIERVETATGGYGSIVGKVESGSTTNIYTSYADASNCTKAIGSGTVGLYDNTDASVDEGGIENAIRLEKSTYIGFNAPEMLGGFDFTDDWSIVVGDQPILKVFEDRAGKYLLDTRWYYAFENEFVLYDVGDLYGFAWLVNHEITFNGKTVKLANDIEIQDGDANTWASSAPKLTWIPAGTAIQNSSYKDDLINPFNGTFNGQGYTISGVYANGDEKSYVNSKDGMYQGLFGATGTSAVLQNFRLENSYIKGSHASGAIAGAGNGTFKNIYSEAIVDGTGAGIGGMIGRNYNSGIVMENCWNAGPVSTTRTSANTNTGGLVGLVGVASSFTNCMNTGSVSATNSDHPEIALGGLVGRAQANVTITDCLNTGSISQHATATSGFGSILGNVESGTTKIYTSYADASNCTEAVGTSGATLYNHNNAVIEEGTVLVESSKITGVNAIHEVIGFDCVNNWTFSFDEIPILTVFEDKAEGNLIDTKWYDASKTEFTLYDKADFYGFLAISTTTGFKDKTIKLGADIEVNTGDAKDWENNTPDLTWRPIGEQTTTSTWYYEGTFDGQGHTLRGIYLKTSRRYAGLFAAIYATGVVQNVRLENSYFETDWDSGSIAGLCEGKLYNIYSNAIIKGNAMGIGGLIGLANNSEEVVLENCWFDGSVTNAGNQDNQRATGGLVGQLDAENTTKFTLRNCLNTGAVDVSAYTYNQGDETDIMILPCAGGFIGEILNSGSLECEIDSCLNTGEIKVHTNATDGYGPIIGYSTPRDAVTIYKTYATVETSNNNINRNGLNVVDASTIKGTVAKTNMPLLGWESDWNCVEGDFPEIILSNTDFGGADVIAKPEDLTDLQTLYANRILYRGDLHARAQTLSKEEDGTKSLADWSTQMNTLGLNFAASLSHQQTNHYNNESIGWDLSKFVYGTKAGTSITDRSDQTSTGTLRYNMLFPNQEKLLNVLNTEAFATKYMYNSETDFFAFNDFTKEEFASLIQKVRSEGGFFVHAHPTQTSYSTVDSDYYFTDYAGFEVFYLNTPNITNMTDEEKAAYTKYGAYGSNESEAQYKVWDRLLKDNRRLYACAGSNTQGDLNTYALTSVYSTSAASTDKGAIITQLIEGDFTAGAVGIQMSIDNTKMGGHFAFADTSRLVVNVGDFFFDSNNVVDSTHKYRVDVITEDGVVYSRRLIMNGTTPTNGTIALDVDATSKYYRVEIVDATIGHRIAIGNPIWNDN